MNDVVFLEDLKPGDEFIYKGKQYRLFGHMIRNQKECAACYEAPATGPRLLIFLDLSLTVNKVFQWRRLWN